MEQNTVLVKNGVAFDFGAPAPKRAVATPCHQGLGSQEEVGFHGGASTSSSMGEVDNGVNATVRASY